MITLLKNKKQIKNKIFLNSKLGSINIFFIDKSIFIPTNIDIKNKQINFKGLLGELNLKYIDKILFFYKNNRLLFTVNSSKKKKSILNLYIKLIKIKLKGITQGYKMNLILKGIGFKALLNDNVLNLKIGFSHNILIPIPENIKIIIQANNLIFSSNDLIALSQFVHYIRNHKKPEPYKGKGFLLKNEIIIQKEGKKNKKY